MAVKRVRVSFPIVTWEEKHEGGGEAAEEGDDDGHVGHTERHEQGDREPQRRDRGAVDALGTRRLQARLAGRRWIRPPPLNHTRPGRRRRLRRPPPPLADRHPNTRDEAHQRRPACNQRRAPDSSLDAAYH